jgi:hypothetical protein
MSKQRRAYCRKLLLAHLVASGRQDLRSLEACSGMPRRTVQDCLADLGDIGIDCVFVQDGPKNNHGYYHIADWGDHDPDWIARNAQRLEAEIAAAP